MRESAKELKRAKLSVAIPASIVSDTPHLREKTFKIGLIGRAAAIFRVDEIIIFPDISSKRQSIEMNLVSKVLSYLETPQYLRKELFNLSPELQYAGALPPLRTPHHPLNRRMRELKVGEFREAFTISTTGVETRIDIGVEQPAIVRKKALPSGKRVTVKIVKVGEVVEAELANRDDAPSYWGYKVIVKTCSLGELLKTKDYDVIVGTSRYGSPIADVAKEIAGKLSNASRILVAFGAPSQGLHEIVEREKRRLGDLVDYLVNTIPVQGTETVRTEEALIASLAVLNLLPSLVDMG
jgi:predicted SPOUT superfamily RNA methylase MTH1